RPYMWGDWRPHFNYVPSHPAGDHLNRPGGNITAVAIAVDSGQLNSFVVRLVYKKKLLCSGLILDANRILTVSGCLAKKPLSKVYIKLLDGSIYWISNTSETTDFTTPGSQALLTRLYLTKPLPKDYSRAPPICPGLLRGVEKVETWYWNIQRTIVKKKLLPQMDINECRKVMDDDKNGKEDEETVRLQDSMLSCVKNTKETSRCEKTRGMPYVWNGRFCGMNISGHNCPKPQTIDVYVRLLTVKSYISRQLREVRDFKMFEVIS
ncbi:hypothetical protein KR222_009466, partial [Zaprionus bogoriensis]